MLCCKTDCCNKKGSSCPSAGSSSGGSGTTKKTTKKSTIAPTTKKPLLAHIAEHENKVHGVKFRFFGRAKRGHSEAEAICKSQGAGWDLIRVTTKDRRQQMVDLDKQYNKVSVSIWWAQGKSATARGTVKLSDGSTWNASLAGGYCWANKFEGDCLYYNQWCGSFAMKTCSSKEPFICQYTPPVAKKVSSLGSGSISGQGYEPGDDEKKDDSPVGLIIAIVIIVVTIGGIIGCAIACWKCGCCAKCCAAEKNTTTVITSAVQPGQVVYAQPVVTQPVVTVAAN